MPLLMKIWKTPAAQITHPFLSLMTNSAKKLEIIQNSLRKNLQKALHGCSVE